MGLKTLWWACEYQEGDCVADVLGPQTQYLGGKLRWRKTVGHMNVQDQDRYGNGEYRVGEEYDALQFPPRLWPVSRRFAHRISFLAALVQCPAV
jgi:hypothetical protein